jgi:hypothetical protein
VGTSFDGSRRRAAPAARPAASRGAGDSLEQVASRPGDRLADPMRAGRGSRAAQQSPRDQTSRARTSLTQTPPLSADRTRSRAKPPYERCSPACNSGSSPLACASVRKCSLRRRVATWSARSGELPRASAVVALLSERRTSRRNSFGLTGSSRASSLAPTVISPPAVTTCGLCGLGSDCLSGCSRDSLCA